MSYQVWKHPDKGDQLLGCGQVQVGTELLTKTNQQHPGPMRSIFKMAFKSEIVDDNIMLKVENLRTDPPMINPLTPMK